MASHATLPYFAAICTKTQPKDHLNIHTQSSLYTQGDHKGVHSWVGIVSAESTQQHRQMIQERIKYTNYRLQVT